MSQDQLTRVRMNRNAIAIEDFSMSLGHEQFDISMSHFEPKRCRKCKLFCLPSELTSNSKVSRSMRWQSIANAIPLPIEKNSDEKNFVCHPSFVGWNNVCLSPMGDHFKKQKRCNGKSIEAIITDVNRSLRGWYEYFKHSNKAAMTEVDKWIRMRLQSILRKRR